MDVDLACRALLGFVFAAAAIGKLRSPVNFAESLAGLGIKHAKRPMAAAVIGAEALCVVFLVLLPPLGYVLALLLLAAFSAGIALTIKSQRVVRCNCFGAGGKQLGVPHLVRNGLLGLVALVGLAAGQLPAMGPQSLVALGLGAFLSLLFIRWDDLTYLFTSD
ncbi:MAG TPA: methylamine utilization protein MauE [Micromonosporaceae bacterium]|nr:methylamine utilization protein MauE [Micromonosporaceae bacterium]HCU49242.1 methylamine utilization protein MauE [Micromonosporaceae bacterium]